MKTLKQLLLILGLALSVGAGRAQTTTNLLSETKFDAESPSPWGYGYYYNNNGYGTYSYNRQFYMPDDVDMTNALFQLTFDMTDLLDTVNYGVGAGTPLFKSNPDPTAFSSGDRANYIMVFDARVDGLLPTTASGNAEMQVQFYYVDANSQTAKYLQVNKGFQPTGEWQTFAFTLDQGGLGDNTADVDLESHHAETTELRINVNMHEPFVQFGYDGDNALYLDNVKVYVRETPPPVVTPTYATTVMDWNMDDKGVWSEWHYEWSQNDNHAVFFGSNNANNNSPNTFGVDGTSAWYLSMDNSTFVDAAPQWAGGGSGGNGPVDFTKFDTADLSKYRVSFDARVDGLTKTDTTLTLQVFMDCPDDTFTPADDDANADFVARFDMPIPHLTADWQHFTALLSKAGVGGGSKVNFETYYNKISGLRTQWQIENGASLGDWGYDADNMLIIDNIKLERLYEGLGDITYTVAGDQLTLNWTAASTGQTQLQSATTVEGPFADVAAAQSPFTVPAATGNLFFRLSWTQP